MRTATHTTETLSEKLATASTIRVSGGTTLVRINDYLWRVTARDGFVYGHIERTLSASGERFVAKRYQTFLGKFVSIGQFWRIDDAVESLRLLAN